MVRRYRPSAAFSSRRARGTTTTTTSTRRRGVAMNEEGNVNGAI
jgi:hypothetical protein